VTWFRHPVAAAEEGAAVRDIAEVIGRHLGIPATSVAVEKATEHFGWFGASDRQ
jgi:hypothetical protein